MLIKSIFWCQLRLNCRIKNFWHLGIPQSFFLQNACPISIVRKSLDIFLMKIENFSNARARVDDTARLWWKISLVVGECWEKAHGKLVSKNEECEASEGSIEKWRKNLCHAFYKETPQIAEIVVSFTNNARAPPFFSPNNKNNTIVYGEASGII